MNKSTTAEAGEVKGKLMGNKEHEQMFLNKYSMIAMESDCDDVDLEQTIADEATSPMRVPSFDHTASHVNLKIRDSIVTAKWSSYFKNKDEDSFEKIREQPKRRTDAEYVSLSSLPVYNNPLSSTDTRKTKDICNAIRNISKMKRSKFEESKSPLNSSTSSEETSEFKLDPKFIKQCGCPSILIVDDQYINRFIIQQFCEKYGIKSKEAEDGQEAIDIIRQEATKVCCEGIHMVLMDLNMPVMGGIESAFKLTRMKMRHEINQDLRIVAVTAFPSESEKEKCFKVGMTDFYIKPFTFNNFTRLISTKS